MENIKIKMNKIRLVYPKQKALTEFSERVLETVRKGLFIYLIFNVLLFLYKTLYKTKNPIPKENLK
jgi:hypothetical protein